MPNDIRALKRRLDPILQRPRIDMTLLSFALAGLAIALLLPPKDASGRGGGSYAIAISSGDALKLATGGSATLPADAELNETAARILACRNVVSVGTLDIGARCRQTTPQVPRVALGR